MGVYSMGKGAMEPVGVLGPPQIDIPTTYPYVKRRRSPLTIVSTFTLMTLSIVLLEEAG